MAEGSGTSVKPSSSPTSGEGTPQVSDANAPTAKKRYSLTRSSACHNCRGARARCSHERPQCQRCRNQKRECVYERDVEREMMERKGLTGSSKGKGKALHALTTSQRDTISPHPDPTGINQRVASKQELRKLLTAYFTHVYHVQAMSFLHRAQLFRQIEQGQTSPILVKAICGLSARFLPGADILHPEGGVQAGLWMSEAKAALIADTNRFSTSKLAAILCILQHEFNCGRTGSAWMFVAMAVRMAFALGLNVENRNSTMSWIEREQRRRLMWATYCADSFCSSGWPEYSLLKAEDVHIALPTDEPSFLLGTEKQMKTLAELLRDADNESIKLDTEMSENLITRWIWIMKLRNDLLSYVRRINQQREEIWGSDSYFLTIIRSLRRWRDTLPPSLELTVDNLYARQATRELDGLMVLHLCFDSVHSTLYRITLPNFTESANAETLAGAPWEWIQEVRYAAFTRAKAVQQKLEMLVKHFPDHIPASRIYNLYILNSLRVQLQYLATTQDGRTPSPEATRGFKLMAEVVGKMTDYFYYNRRVLRDILHILRSYDYAFDTEYDDRIDATSGARTPNDVSGALSGVPVIPARPIMKREAAAGGPVNIVSNNFEVVDYRDPISEASKISPGSQPPIAGSSYSLTSSFNFDQGNDPNVYQQQSQPILYPAISVQNLPQVSGTQDTLRTQTLLTYSQQPTFGSPGDYLTNLINGSSLDALAAMSELWDPPNVLDPDPIVDFSQSSALPSRTFADMTSSQWASDINHYFFDLNAGG